MHLKCKLLLKHVNKPDQNRITDKKVTEVYSGELKAMEGILEDSPD